MGVRAILPRTTGAGALDLLDVEAVVGAAAAAGADAVHPGFGFLAENAGFAEAVLGAGMRWVGPPPAAMRTMGDKARARRLAAELGVPVLPGYDEADQSDAALLAAARRIGVPLVVKPAGGGGGKGMRVVRDLAAFPDALAASRREAAAAFADDRVVLERYLDGPRHVEVQVLFDADGAGVHLGERDCSTQRRHQKVLEETPCPAVDEPLRSRLGEAALRLGSAVGYRSAGTVEFLLDDGGGFHFLEMNTRLQVEHPVTEMVTGRDLVEDQLRIAAGEAIEPPGPERRPGGHAVEVRLYAEDAEAGFLPATGRAVAVRWPGGDAIRVDAGLERGEEVSARFDPLLAKLIAWGKDRESALSRLAAGLDDTLVLGVTTNLAFLRWLVRQPWLRAGEARVDTLELAWDAARAGASGPEHVSAGRLPDDAWETAARVLARSERDPWGGGWRLDARSVLQLAAEDVERRVVIAPQRPSDAAGTRAFALDGTTVHVDVDGRSIAFRLAPPPEVDATARAARARSRSGISSTGGPAQVIAPMPGSVVAVHVAPGAEVEAGDRIVTLEAMKMEHLVTAPAAGRVTGVSVAVGSQVVRGQPIAVVEPDAPADDG